MFPLLDYSIRDPQISYYCACACALAVCARCWSHGRLAQIFKRELQQFTRHRRTLNISISS